MMANAHLASRLRGASNSVCHSQILKINPLTTFDLNILNANFKKISWDNSVSSIDAKYSNVCFLNNSV